MADQDILLPVAATPQLKKWIEDNLDKHGWSMREASMRAGLSEGRISQIMRDQVPGVEACIKLANLFNVPATHVLYLAGYLERDPSRGVPPELQDLVNVLESMKDEGIYEPTLRAIRMVIDIALARIDALPDE